MEMGRMGWDGGRLSWSLFPLFRGFLSTAAVVSRLGASDLRFEAWCARGWVFFLILLIPRFRL